MIERMHDRQIPRTTTEQLSLFNFVFGVGHTKIKSDLFEQIVSIENLFFAWERFCKGKRKRQDVMLYERYLEDHLFSLQEELVSGTYVHSPYEPFTIYDPKQRLIHKACVKDRVVHQAIVNIIEPLFEKRFIHDSYSCRVGKGTHVAVRRLQTFLRREGKNNTKTVYALKCDVRKFFASVSHEVLLHQLSQSIDCIKTMALIKGIIQSYSTSHGTGIPLGNLTSQLFANVYLHELDWYVKQTLRTAHYLRYCDDFVLLVPSIAEGMRLADNVDLFLQERLRIQLHPYKVCVRTVKQGVDFLGYRVLEHAVILRTGTKKRVIENINAENVSSYLGVCQHANTYDLQRQLKHFV
ncbi:TPA: RNA-dependent DNA polymerase [Candidatus Uhrbacteria bacterium]|nr:RNA-dependent DNA polymerase [Candidatus Uhrbacteria bacterium]